MLQRMIVPSSKCIPGMVTANPVVDIRTGQTVIAANKELTEKHIQDILKFLHTDIWVYLDSSKKVWNLPEETILNYQSYSDNLLSIVKGISNNDTQSISHFEALAKTLPQDFSSNHTLLGCTHLMEQLDYNAYNHSLNVAFITLLICRWCHFDDYFTETAVQAGLLHDIGLTQLSFNPFTTPKPWTDEQIKEYRKHPIYSYNIVSKIPDLDPEIGKAILAHHEYCDGTGFPVHLSASYMSLLAKILSIADTYELMKSEVHIFDIIKAFFKDRITQFDPYLALTFCNNVVNYYLGTYVILNNNKIGEVVFIEPRCIYRPIIRVNDEFINLYDTPDIEIVDVK